MANSVANFSFNLLGYLPAPMLYGFFYELGEQPHNHWGLLSVQLFTVPALCGLTFVHMRNKWIQKQYSLIEDFSMIGLAGELDEKASHLPGACPTPGSASQHRPRLSSPN